MTSKEAINKLSKYIGELGGGETLEEEDVIIRDLEVLEILKRIDWLVYNNGDKNDFNWYIDTNKSMKITEEEVEKIQEWLKEVLQELAIKNKSEVKYE